MRIAIDYTAAEQSAGIGRYTRELINALQQKEHDHDVRLVVGRDSIAPEPMRSSRLPLTNRHATILWQRLRLPIPIEWLIGEVDIYHATDYLLPPLKRARGVCQVHDLSFLIVP